MKNLQRAAPEEDAEPRPDGEREQHGVQALETALQVLEAFAPAEGPIRLTELAQAAGMHPAKAHRYLVSFVRHGFVVQNADGRYQLGPAAVRVGLSAVAQTDYVRLVTPVLTELSVELQQTVFAAIWSPEGPMILRFAGPWRPIAVNVRIGSVLPLLTSATGRVFTGWHVPALTKHLIEAELGGHQATGRRPATWAHVEALRAEVRAAGLGTVRGEYTAGVNSVAAPIFDYQHQLVAALAVVGLESSLGETELQDAAVRVRSAAAGISSQLGHRPGAGPHLPEPEAWA